jgi:hypothetical protein
MNPFPVEMPRLPDGTLLPIGPIFQSQGEEYDELRIIELAKLYNWYDMDESLERIDHLEEIAENNFETRLGRLKEIQEHFDDECTPEGYQVGWGINDGDYTPIFGVWTIAHASQIKPADYVLEKD